MAERERCDKSKCKYPSIMYQKYSGLHLCKKHFIDDVERKVKREMRKQLMVEREDRIAVALSGGKDSSVLLYLLKKIFKERSDLEFFAITVDEGIKGYREVTQKNAKKMAQELGVKHFCFSFAEEFGFTVDEIAGLGFKQAPCTFCGVLRRKIIERKARELGATKVATGHNLDDESQSILINYIRGDMERLKRLRGKREEFVRRIKPLRKVPEDEVALYGEASVAVAVTGMPASSLQCPYRPLSFRFSVSRMLNEFEKKHPGSKYSLMRGYEKMMEMGVLSRGNTHQYRNERQKLLRCEKCGDVAASRVCKACEIVEKVLYSRSNH
jgi:uncharacterized protein (TIGR00269 family)